VRPITGSPWCDPDGSSSRSAESTVPSRKRRCGSRPTSFRSKRNSSRERRRWRMKDMRRLSDNEIADQLRGAREELFDAKFKLATRQLKNFRNMPQARRKIARLLTVMRERTTESENSGCEDREEDGDENDDDA